MGSPRNEIGLSLVYGFAYLRGAVLFALLFIGCAGRQDRVRLQGDEPGTLYLWSVHDEDDKRLGFLFGSIHLDRLDAKGFDRSVEEAFASSDALVVELAPTSIDAEKIRVAADGDPDIWYDALDDVERQLVQTASDEVDIDLDVFSDAPPWLVRLALVFGAFRERGYSSQRGFEWHFIREAARDKTPVLELETVGEQIKALRGGDTQQQRDLLVATATNIGTIADELERVHSAYAEGADDRLAALLRQPQTRAQRTQQRSVFTARDPAMAARMASLFQRPGLEFVVVGVGHLLGPDNVRARLVDEGLSLRRIGSRGRSENPRRPLVAEPAVNKARFPTVDMDFPPNVERVERPVGDATGAHLSASVGPFRYVYTVSPIIAPIYVDQLFGSIERGIGSSGGLEAQNGRDEIVGGTEGRVHTFFGPNVLFRGAIAYEEGFVHTLGVLGPSNQAIELEERFSELLESFALD